MAVQALSLSAHDDARQSRDRVRRVERVLLVLAGLFVALNHATLLVAQGGSWREGWPVAVWLACALGLHVGLGWLLPHRSPFVIPIVMLLSGWGLTLIARLAPPFVPRQALWLAVASAGCLAASALPPGLRLLRRFRYTWLLLGLALLGATLVFGVNPSGDPNAPRLWLGFRVIFFQPSEILKLLLVVFLASYLADKRVMLTETQRLFGRWRVPSLSYLGPMLLMWGFCIVLLIWQRDLGAASLFFLVFLAMLYVSTGQRGYVLGGLILLAAGGGVGYAMFDVVRLRVDTWWNPWPEAGGRAFQIVQSLLAVASGGLFGEGVGLGAPTFVPVVHSDFVYAAIAEEWGLLGALAVTACLAALVLRALIIAERGVARPFHALLAAGIGMLLGVQSLLIMGGVLKLLPLTGVTLPFVSYGGSSLLSNFIMIGLLLRVSDPTSRLRRDKASREIDGETEGMA
jgi:cell division protein FtsW (lipid II flippase)